jgi:hypothetical protein
MGRLFADLAGNPAGLMRLARMPALQAAAGSRK